MNTLTDCINKIAEYKFSGLRWHCHWKNLWNYLGMQGYYRWQEYRVLDELNDFENFEHHAVSCFGVIPCFSLNSKTITTMSPEQRLEVTCEDRQAHLKLFFTEWLSHEKKGLALLTEAMKWAMAKGQVRAHQIFCDMIVDSEKEIAMIKKEIMFCESVNWDMPTLVNRQEEMHKEYRSKLSKVKKALS